MIRLGKRWQHADEERYRNDWKHAFRIHFCNRILPLNEPRSSEAPRRR
jgi:hypothetical protein